MVVGMLLGHTQDIQHLLSFLEKKEGKRGGGAERGKE